LSGKNLTVNAALSFKPAFVGIKTIYASANSATLNSGWQTAGSWTVTNPASPITLVSVTPHSGSGLSQTFSYLASDQKGAADLTQLWMDISTSPSATANACYSRYDAGPKSLYLLNDTNTAWLGPVTPGSTAILQNSQCVLNASASSVSSSGNNLTVNVSLRFKSPAFNGAKNLYVYANSAAVYTGWLLVGTWTVN
jgi:hypothetical protein